jgi:hypothetical protein
MTIAEIAKERGVTAREVFVEEIEKRGYKDTGEPHMLLIGITDGNSFIKKRRGKINAFSVAGETHGYIDNHGPCENFCLPYTAITIDLINAVAGEPK